MKIFLLIFPLFLLNACTMSASQQPSVLVIAVENLPSYMVMCSDEETLMANSGVSVFCRETIRFTNAFTPSTMSVPTMASFLTGKYPFEHNVRTNQDFLSNEEKTLTENFNDLNFKTSFFGGGGSIWRKSGLNQGFDLFEDNLDINEDRLYRSFSENIQLFFNWWKKDVHSVESAFSVIYVPDLLYVSDKNYKDQFSKFDSSLFQLILKLKSLDAWTHNYVILMGLNGRGIKESRAQELMPLNLHSETTQVALFMKPPQPQRDENLHWEISKNVSLLDVSKTLSEAYRFKTNSANPFEIYNLGIELKSPEWKLGSGRPILIESAWGHWREKTNIRYAIRKEQYLYVHDQKPQIFNTLLDRQELVGLQAQELGNQDLKTQFSEWMSAVKALPFDGLPEEIIHKYATLHDFYLDKNSITNEQLMNRRLYNELMEKLSSSGQWKELFSLNKKIKNETLAFFEKRQTDKTYKSVDPCLSLLSSSESAGHCDSQLFTELVGYMRAKGDEESILRERFLRSYHKKEIAEAVNRWNFVQFQQNSVMENDFEQSLRVDLVLSLQENQKYKKSLFKVK